MYHADLSHDNPALQAKLEKLYSLNRGAKLEMDFRPVYLDLLEGLGNPHLRLPPVIHVAGTNGKGSTIAFLKSLIEAHGKSVHVYTSPHLKRFNERIILNGTQVTDHDLERMIDLTVSVNQNRDISFFEITTAIAFKMFADTPADILLLEVGLGGRFDCTNIIPKQNVAIINKISRDHTDFLGDSLEAITQEKAGIIKSNAPVIISGQSAEFLDSDASQILRDACAAHGATPYFCGEDWFADSTDAGMNFRLFGQKISLPHPGLIGAHQIMNCGAALAALFMIPDIVTPNLKAMRHGVAHATWPARLQNITPDGYDDYDIYFDGGHNDSAGQALAGQAAAWQEQDNKPLYIVAGMKADKDAAAFLGPLAPYMAGLIHIPVPGVGPCLGARDLARALNKDGLQSAGSVAEALALIRQNHPGPARILICGSLYLAEQIL